MPCSRAPARTLGSVLPAASSPAAMRCSSCSAMSRYAATTGIVRCIALMYYRLSQLTAIALAVLLPRGLWKRRRRAGPIALPVILATTTSTQDSGSAGRADPGVRARERIPGQDDRGRQRRGDRDGRSRRGRRRARPLPAAEEELMADGKGGERRTVMHNDFVVVGPAADPAEVRGATAAEALARIAQGEGAVRVARRRVGDPHVRAGLVGGRRPHPEGPLVSGVRPGHGRDAADRQRQGRLHDQRPRHLPGHRERARSRDPRRRRRASCSTSTT